MKQITITRQTVANGKTVRVGEVVDVSDAEARLLVSLGKGVLVVAVAIPAPKAAKAYRPPTKTPMTREAQHD